HAHGHPPGQGRAPRRRHDGDGRGAARHRRPARRGPRPPGVRADQRLGRPRRGDGLDRAAVPHDRVPGHLQLLAGPHAPRPVARPRGAGGPRQQGRRPRRPPGRGPADQHPVQPGVQRQPVHAPALLGRAGRVARLRTPEVRAAILDTPVEDQSVASFLADAWGRMFPLGDPPDYEPPPEASVAARAAREGRRPEEVAYDLLLEDEGRALIYMPLDSYGDGDFRVLHELLSRDDVVLGLGDGGAHCGLLCDASVPSYVLTHWVRDRSRGDRLPLEHAVNLQTRRNAALFGFDDRGLVAAGHLADLNVIDLD